MEESEDQVEELAKLEASNGGFAAVVIVLAATFGTRSSQGGN